MPFGRFAARYKKAPKLFVYGAWAHFLINTPAQSGYAYVSGLRSAIDPERVLPEETRKRFSGEQRLAYVRLVLIIVVRVFRAPIT